MKLITEAEEKAWAEKLKKAREEDLANGWDPDAPEEGDGIDPKADVVAIFTKKGKEKK